MNAIDVANAALEVVDGEAEAVAHVEHSGLARFAGSEVHQPTLIENAMVTLRVVQDTRVGVATTNKIDADGLAEVAERARAAARSAPPDDGFPGLAPPADPPKVEGFDEDTARLGPEEQAQLADAAIEAGGDVPVYGFFTSAMSELAVASSTGLSVQQRMTDATALVVAADENGSGYAEQTAWRAGGIDPALVAQEAAEKARRTRGGGEIEPGVYRAVLEPYAFADLLDYFSHDSFGALGLLEERSYFAGRLGEKVFDEKISITDDALDPRGLPKSFDFEGTPKQRVAACRARRRPRSRLGPHDGSPVEERRAVHRPRTSRRAARLGPVALRALSVAWGRRIGGGARASSSATVSTSRVCTISGSFIRARGSSPA